MSLEGPDAAGKGGAIKRVTERLDPRLVRVYSIVKPTPEEYQHHYMWRFWKKLPPHGEITIFDRSWYGRVLVERVEKFCTEAEWKRAYREINEFERQLADDGVILIKFYLHITKDEQLDRFKRREADPYKHWKISDEDWRNRNHWDQHNEAAEDLFEKTSFDHAPWIVIPANYKWYARVKVVKSVAQRVGKTLKRLTLLPGSRLNRDDPGSAQACVDRACRRHCWQAVVDLEKCFGLANGGTGGDAFGNSSGLLERATQSREQDGIFVKPRPRGARQS